MLLIIVLTVFYVTLCLWMLPCVQRILLLGTCISIFLMSGDFQPPILPSQVWPLSMVVAGCSAFTKSISSRSGVVSSVMDGCLLLLIFLWCLTQRKAGHSYLGPPQPETSCLRTIKVTYLDWGFTYSSGPHTCPHCLVCQCVSIYSLGWLKQFNMHPLVGGTLIKFVLVKNCAVITQ